jgi:hypothetical protein
MKKTLLPLLLLALCGTYKTQAQGMAVNTSGNAANSSAMLDVSSTTQGVLVPRMTAIQRAAITGVQGLLVYQTDAPAGFYYYNGGWISLLASSSTLDATKLSGALPALDGSALTNLPSSGGGAPIYGTPAIKTTNYTMQTTDVLIYTVTDGLTFTLPSASAAGHGKLISVMSGSSNGVNVVPISGNSMVLPANSTVTGSTNFYQAVFISDGSTRWICVSELGF